MLRCVSPSCAFAAKAHAVFDEGFVRFTINSILLRTTIRMTIANLTADKTADRKWRWTAGFGVVGAMTGHIRLLCVLCVSVATSFAAEPAKPNVVYIMADDVGWGDLSVHGGGVPTPNIDRLFARGVELTRFMGWCVCTPTRAMLLTGRHPIRVGTAPEVGGELDPDETTIAEGFKANGYRTGVFGKWHNGEDPDTPEFRAAFAEAYKGMPNKKFSGGHGAGAHGFDESWVYYGGGSDYFNRRTAKGSGPVSWWHNNKFRASDEGYTDDLVTRYAIDFIRESKDQPFFCYVPFHIAHAPLQAKENDLAAIDPQTAATLPAASEKTSAADKRVHAAMLHSMDNNVAAIEAELERLGLTDNTILVFTSDNGAMEAGSSLPLRGHKHTIYDGGVRLPTVVHWPKGGLVGGKKWDGLCGALDMFPTLMAMTGSEMPPTRPLDGKNIWPSLRENQASPVESYYWVWRDEDTIRTDQWKLHRFFNRYELYDISNDETESNNVADSHPAEVQSLVTKMDAWADSLGVAIGHRPAPKKYHAAAAPQGEVLAVTVTISDKAKPRDRLAVSLANWSGTQYATDWIEYDIAFSTDTPKRHPYFSTLEGNNSKPFGPLFKQGTGVDQFGRDQSTGPGIADGKSTWEHRIVGLSSTAAGPLGKHGVVFSGGDAGTFTIYLDNLRIRHSDGSTTPLWTNGKDTRVGTFKANEFFNDLKVRTVNVADVGQAADEVADEIGSLNDNLKPEITAIATANEVKPPNIVVIVADDLGYADVVFNPQHPHEVTTPHLGALATESVICRQGYVSGHVCSPTRAGLMTGRYQQRLGLYTGGEAGSGLPMSETIFPQYLAPEGYVTCQLGKWHLGPTPQWSPALRGFDEVFGFLGRGAHDYFKLSDPNDPIYRGTEPVEESGYLTDRLGEEAVSFVERHRSQPFFLYLAFNAVHAPLQAPVDEVARFDTGNPDRNTLLAMGKRMDDAIGSLVGALKKEGVWENTLLFFISDNGGPLAQSANNTPLRGGKHQDYEGGIRVPFLVCWPGKLTPGESDAVISSLDILPTSLAAARISPPNDKPFDGTNMLPILGGESARVPRDLFWCSGGEEGWWAIRSGDWKLVGDKNHVGLFDLSQDVSEQRDLASAMPEKLAELTSLHDAWLAEMADPKKGGSKRYSHGQMKKSRR